MRERQRRASAQEWLRTGATVTVKTYATRYGVDRYTAYDDLTALGVALPDSAQRWAQRPPATPRNRADHRCDEWDETSLIVVDGRPFYAACYTSDGAPLGRFADETSPD